MRRRFAELKWRLLYSASHLCDRRSRDAAYAGRIDAAGQWWRAAEWFGKRARAAESRARLGG